MKISYIKEGIFGKYTDKDRFKSDSESRLAQGKQLAKTAIRQQLIEKLEPIIVNTINSIPIINGPDSDGVYRGDIALLDDMCQIPLCTNDNNETFFIKNIGVELLPDDTIKILIPVVPLSYTPYIAATFSYDPVTMEFVNSVKDTIQNNINSILKNAELTYPIAGCDVKLFLDKSQYMDSVLQRCEKGNFDIGALYIKKIGARHKDSHELGAKNLENLFSLLEEKPIIDAVSFCDLYSDFTKYKNVLSLIKYNKLSFSFLYWPNVYSLIELLKTVPPGVFVEIKNNCSWPHHLNSSRDIFDKIFKEFGNFSYYDCCRHNETRAMFEISFTTKTSKLNVSDITMHLTDRTCQYM